MRARVQESQDFDNSITTHMAALPFISVIVPVRNEAAYIGRTLRLLLDQDYDSARFEVIVVDGGSSDGTRNAVVSMQQSHPQLRLLHNPRRLSSAARNIGVRAARGDLLVIVDGHAEVDGPQFLRHIADAFDQSGADCLGRPQPLDPAGASGFQRAIAAARASWLGHHPASFVYSDAQQFVPAQSVAVAYRRSLFDSVGLFDESFDACEDVEFNHRVDRAGLSCFFVPQISVRYHPRANLKALFRQMMRYGRGRARFLRKHPETLSLGTLLPAVFVAGLPVGALISVYSMPIAVLYGSSLAVYIAIVLGVSMELAHQHRRLIFFVWIALIFVTIHVACGAGMLMEMAQKPPLEQSATRRTACKQI
jgi:succinoglycan biosynthesis protein ExoA